jgi:hypothetical protein
MKLLTDFDGVWTDPSEEAAVGFDVIVDEVSRLTGKNSTEILPRIRSIREDVLADPTNHGWESNGALAAFSEEDPYITNNAICRSIALNHADLWEAVREEHGDFDKFSYSCYRGGVERFGKRETPLLRTGATEILERLLAAGWEIVYASNSTGEKLRGCLGNLAAESGGPIRIRGSARKFVLTSDDENATRDFCGRKVRTDRGHYRDILEEEMPDIIIGDVFSLDLALPADMVAKGIPYLQKGLLLYRTGYTPSWAVESASATPGIGIVDSLEAFASHLSSLS